jgi:hypothetical protein
MVAIHARIGSVPTPRGRFQFLLSMLAAALLAGTSAGVQAQVFDRIDVAAGEREAEIVVRFSHRIQYLRHGPQGEVKEARVFLRLLTSGVTEDQLMQDTARSPAVPGVPVVTAVFPELRNGMLISFSQPTPYAVKPGADGRSIVLTVPRRPVPPAKAVDPKVALPVPAVVVPEQPALPGASATADNEAKTRAYLDEARQALAAGDAATAVNRLNRILGLPRSAQTESAQALIGEAREAGGDTFKARAEYELYLKLFPAGPNVAKIRKKLAALPREGTPSAVVESPVAVPERGAEWTVSGSLSSYYYAGKSQIEILTPPPPGELTFNRETLSTVDQKSVISSINLNARRRTTDHDTRLVLRDTDNRNHLDPERSYNRLYAAYLDHADKRRGYTLRAGRQNPQGMGVLERFDGAQAGLNAGGSWRANVVGGRAVEFDSPFEKVFYGVSADYLTTGGQPAVSVYAVNQTLDKLDNRRAVGTELRYFDGQFSAYGTVDYDVLYRELNIALAQANYLDAGGNNYFVVIDHRRTPSLGLTNALVAAPGFTLQQMIDAQGIDAVRRQAVGLSALSDLFSVGVTHPLGSDWQVGIDYRLSEISDTEAVEAVLPLAVVGTCLGTVDAVANTCTFTTPAQPGTGRTKVVSLQAIGNHFGVRNATGVLTASLIDAPTYRGEAYGLSYALPLGESWRIDSNLRYYTQRDDSGDHQNRVTPSLRIAWQWRSRLYLEAEAGEERSHSVVAGRDDTVVRDYWYAGLRWDFR